jgi:hypothetical protein
MDCYGSIPGKRSFAGFACLIAGWPTHRRLIGGYLLDLIKETVVTQAPGEDPLMLNKENSRRAQEDEHVVQKPLSSLVQRAICASTTASCVDPSILDGPYANVGWDTVRLNRRYKLYV